MNTAALIEDLTAKADHYDALAVSWFRSGDGYRNQNTGRAIDRDMIGFCRGKAQAYELAAYGIRESIREFGEVK